MGTEPLVNSYFLISLVSDGYEMIELMGFVGDDFQPGATRVITSSTDMNVMDAKLMVISVKDREKNTFLTNTSPDVVGSRILGESIYISDLQVYGYERWVFECDIRNIKKWFWNYKLHFQFKDEGGNVLTEFSEDLPENFEKDDYWKAVLETDVDLSKASSLEIELLRKASPKIERSDMEINHLTTDGSQISVENIYAVREANCEWWDVSIAFRNNGTEKKRVSIEYVDFSDASFSVVGGYDQVGHVDLAAGESAIYEIQVYDDIESMYWAQIRTNVAVFESPEPTEPPIVTVSPEPTESPIVTESPKPTATPVVTVSPKPTTTPVVTATPKPTTTPVVTTTPKPTTTPNVTESPKPTATARVTEKPKVTTAPIVAENPKLTDIPITTKSPEVTFPPSDVKGVKAKVMGNSVKVSWNLTKGASTYRIYRSTKKNTGYKLIKEVVGKAKYIDRKVKKGSFYYYKICVAGSETFSKPVLVRLPYYMQPIIKVKNKSFSSSLNYVEITLKKYEGKNLQLYYKKGKGKFKRVSLRSNRLKKGKNVFRISYQKTIKTLYFKARTYGKLKGKKRYSDFSKTVRIKNGK